MLPAAGITRLADITGLDWIGVPVYQAMRPNSRVLAVATGKGLTRAQAQVSALMEALEGFHAEEIDQPTVCETVGRMRRQLAYDPYALPLSEPSFLHDRLAIEWVAATDLWTGAPSWVPRQLCELNFCVTERCYTPLFRRSSNGLASGNRFAEALVHGLCEVIERDACWRNDRARFDPERSVAVETVYPRLAQRLLGHFARAGMETAIVDMSGPTGLPCFEAWLDHSDGPGLMRGAGCHPSRLIALLRALTECAQSRLTYISGSRDDIHRRTYQSATSRSAVEQFRPVPNESRRSFASAPTLAGTGFRAQVRAIVSRIQAVTGMSPLAVDLKRAGFGIPVVFVLAPGLSTRKIL